MEFTQCSFKARALLTLLIPPPPPRRTLHIEVFHPKKWGYQHLGCKLCSACSSFESHQYRLTDTSMKFISDSVLLRTRVQQLHYADVWDHTSAVISTASPKTDNLPSSFSFCAKFCRNENNKNYTGIFCCNIVLLCTTHQFLLKKFHHISTLILVW
jgi:hypothetical protein